MHDGHHFPLGAESMFLDSLSTPHTYHRCAKCPECAVCANSNWKTARIALMWIAGRRLLEGRAFEASLPRVLSATADVQDVQQTLLQTRNTSSKQHENVGSTHQFRVHAHIFTGNGSAARWSQSANASGMSVLLWWNSAPNRSYNSPAQPEWQSVTMAPAITLAARPELAPAGSDFSTHWIAVPAGHEGAWYVEVRVVLKLLRSSKTVPVSDSSPVRFVYRQEATKRRCDTPSTHFCG
jgi:hypothetical protein